MTSIPIDVLRAFVAVVEKRGFTRAAEDLGRTQPTISLQVKRLEELMEAPLFEKASRLELTQVGAICYNYGKRLLRLHDDMMDEASSRRTLRSSLRVGLATELATRLAASLPLLKTETGTETGIELLTGESSVLAVAFEDSGLDLALVIGDERREAYRWSAPMRWFGAAPLDKGKAVPLVIPPLTSVIAEAALNALRDAGRKFAIVLSTADFNVLSAAAFSGMGLAPMIEGLAPEGAKHRSDKSLPGLPPVTISLLARGEKLGHAGRRWLGDHIKGLRPL